MLIFTCFMSLWVEGNLGFVLVYLFQFEKTFYTMDNMVGH